ncbi:hypothetical protein [Streptomyces sp. NPDC001843]|uniref:hypothetical protein n=1 Tax=Streptomyces sp. NPDC001843 TaxID=3364617 RepID=UPI0036C6AAA4
MPVTEAEVLALRRDHPGIGVLARETRPTTLLMARWRALLAAQPLTGQPDVVAVTVGMRGIAGGGSWIRQDYGLVLDVSALHRRLPTVWITAPTDVQIRHVNIWRSADDGAWCPWLGMRLPYVCWFTYADAWSGASPSNRTLGAALEYVKQLLNTENHDSPAR